MTERTLTSAFEEARQLEKNAWTIASRLLLQHGNALTYSGEFTDGFSQTHFRNLSTGYMLRQASPDDVRPSTSLKVARLTALDERWGWKGYDDYFYRDLLISRASRFEWRRDRAAARVHGYMGRIDTVELRMGTAYPAPMQASNTYREAHLPRGKDEIKYASNRRNIPRVGYLVGLLAERPDAVADILPDAVFPLASSGRHAIRIFRPLQHQEGEGRRLFLGTGGSGVREIREADYLSDDVLRAMIPLRFAVNYMQEIEETACPLGAVPGFTPAKSSLSDNHPD